MSVFAEDVSLSTNKSDFVYRTLRNSILSGAYAPGTALFIREISLQMNVSRTPVKEAINRLAYEGYLEFLPNHCAIVSRISSAEIIELLELRECLEGSAAYYAAIRRTDGDVQEFERIFTYHCSIPRDDDDQIADWDKRLHMAIARATYNQHLYDTIMRVFVKLARISLPISRDRIDASRSQHRKVLDAIERKDASDARKFMLEHNRDILSSVRQYQFQNIHLFK